MNKIGVFFEFRFAVPNLLELERTLYDTIMEKFIMKKIISYFTFIIITLVPMNIISQPLNFYSATTTTKNIKGTVNGIIILKESKKSDSYFILDFQGSKAIKKPACQCHMAFEGYTTSGKSNISIVPSEAGFVHIVLLKLKYRNTAIDEYVTAIEKKEENMNYTIFKFKKDLELEATDASDKKLYIDKESILVYCFQNND